MDSKINIKAILKVVDGGLNGSLTQIAENTARLETQINHLFSSVSDPSAVTTAFNGVKDSFKDLNMTLASFGLPSIESMFTNFGSQATTQLGKAAGAFNTLGKKSQGLTDVVSTSFSKMQAPFKDLPTKMLDPFISLDSKVMGFTKNLSKTVTSLAPQMEYGMVSLELGVGKVLNKLDSGALNVAGFFESISLGSKKMAGEVPLITKAFGGIGQGIQKSAGVGTTALTSMVQGLTSVMGFALKALGPAAILGVALVGFGMLDSQMGGQISKMIETVTTKGPEMIKGFVSGILAKLPELMNSGAQIVSGLALAISENLPVIMQSAMALLNGLIDGVVVNLPTLIPAALMIIESLATSLLELAPQLLLTGLNLLISLIDGILANQGQLVATVTTIIESFTNITDNLPQILDKGIEILVKLAEGIASVLPQLIPVALKAITTLVSTLSENLPKLLNAAVEIVGKLCEGLLANLPQILSAAVELILALVMGIGNSIPKVIQAGAEILLKFIETFGKALPDLKDAGMNLMKGLIDGIGGMVNTVIETVKNIGKSIGDTFKNIFKIHSPSRWMRDEIGAMLPAGLAIGIERNAYVVDQAMDHLASDIMLPSLDSLNQQVDTVQKLSVHSSSAQTQQNEKQPATFNIKLGNQNFKAFVSDISEAMGQDAAINLAF
ncbi:phage tail protein [Enterococcus rivorum]|uniref:phage tail protein n=1 Tax=Enterococcus rivorum TaxID=762845 RepID=UPI00363EEC42